MESCVCCINRAVCALVDNPTIAQDNTGVDNNSLYTQPEDIWDIYKAFSEVSDCFSIAAAFGNVHGVYSEL